MIPYLGRKAIVTAAIELPVVEKPPPNAGGSYAPAVGRLMDANPIAVLAVGVDCRTEKLVMPDGAVKVV